MRNCFKTLEIPPAPDSIHLESKSMPWQSILPHCKSTGNPDRNQSRSIPVPSGTVGIWWGTAFKHLKYYLPQCSSVENGNPHLGSLFSPNRKSLRCQTAIRVDISQFHPELFRFNEEQIWNTWSTPYLRLHLLRIEIHALTVCSPQQKSTGNPDGNQSIC